MRARVPQRDKGCVVGLVTELIAPYRIPVFNALAELLDGRLHVFFLSAMAGRPWPVHRDEVQFSYEVLPGAAWQPLGHRTPTLYLNLPLLLRLRRCGVGPLIVGGYNHPEFLWSLLHGRRTGWPVMLWSESVDAAERPARIRTAVKRSFVAACDGYVVPGTRAEDQLRYLGASTQAIFHAPNAVDTAFWGNRSQPRNDSTVPPRLLFVGNLLDVKGVDVLLRALDHPSLRSLHLDVVGSGPKKAALQDLSHRAGLDVSFHGELDRLALRERYRAADVLVLPTRSDPWGLVLNEGMCSGCVPVTTTAAGAVPDLVSDGETGVVVPAADVEALRAALVRLATDSSARARLSRAAIARAASFSPQRCAGGFVTALEAMGCLG